MSETFTGTCGVCHKSFADCGCTLEAQILYSRDPYKKEEPHCEVEDLIHTIGAHCQIARLIIEQKAAYLLPEVLKDIYDLSLCLPQYFVKEG